MVTALDIAAEIGGSMTSSQDFFQGRQPAAVLKHHLLMSYATVFIAALGSKYQGRPVWLIDGFAGPGYYDHSPAAPGASGTRPPRQAGSPIVAMRLAKKWRNQRDVRCAFIEKDPRFAGSLREAIEPFVTTGLVANVHLGEVAQHLPQCLAAADLAPALTLLDPFGVANVPLSMVTDILSRPPGEPPVELMLNINLEAVRRIGGLLERRPDGSVGVKPGCPPRGLEPVDAFIGDTWWRENFVDVRDDQGSAAAAAEAVVARYRAEVQRATGKRSISVPIRRRPGTPALFHLTLFFEHPMAGYKFADSAAKATAAWRHAYEAQLIDELAAEDGAQTALFDLAPIVLDDRGRAMADQEAAWSREWVETIAGNIRTSLADGRDLHLATDITSILGTTLALAGEPAIKKAWDQLHQAGVAAKRDTSTRKMWDLRITRP